MTDNIDITISSTFRDTGIKAAEAAFQKLQAAQQKAAAAAQKALASPGDAKLANAAQKAAQAVDRASASYLKAAQASARLASASGDAAGAVNVLSTAMGRVDRSTVAAVNAQTQLQRALNATERSAREAAGGAAVLPRTLENFGAGAVGQMKQFAAGIAGVGAAFVAVSGVTQFAADAVELSNRTSDAKRSLEALAGTPKLYAQALQVATAQQRLFGGSLEENISGIQGLITVSRSSGVELNKLIDITQRLSVKDPAQGIAGARIALNEALAGDPTSLAKRYEIPRAALAKIRDESVGAGEKLAILDQYLSGIGITSEVVTGAIGENTIAFNQAAAGAEKAQIAVGTLIATQAAPWARAFGDALVHVADGLNNIGNAGASVRAIEGAVINGAGSFDAYKTKMSEVNAQLGQVGQAVIPLTQAQYQYAQSLIASGTAAGAAVEQARSYGQELGTVNSAQEQMVASGERSAEAAQELSTRLQTQIALGGGAAATAGALADGYLMGTVSADQMSAALTRMEQAHALAAANASYDAIEHQRLGQEINTTTAAGQAFIQGLIDQAAKEEESAQKTADLRDAQEQLAAMGSNVNAGLMTAADGAAALALQYGITTAQALALIDAQARIAGGQARLANQKAQTRDLVPGGVGVSSPGKRGQSDAEVFASVEAATKELTAVGQNGQNTRTAGTVAGGRARASAEQSSADKIKQIAQDTAARLVAIDQRAAEQRAKAMASLAAAIGTTSADMVASQEANDLELVGASEDRLAELSAREQAEAQARIASIEAVREARAIADAGDAEQAQAVLEQRQQQISAQQQLDEEYAKRRAELAGDPAATEALKQQYDEATAALADATQVRIDLAAQEAQQRADALAAEKQAVLDGASAQAAALGTTGAAADTAAGRVRALTDAINSIPEAKTVTINVVEKGGSGGASSSSSGGGAPSSSGGGGGDSAKMAGGGILTGVTNGPMTVTLGDNPGGREAYAISATPLSGAGHSTATAGHLRLAGGTADADAIRRLEDANRRQILPTASGGGAPARSGGGGGSGGGDAKAGVDEALKNEKEALQLIKDVADLRKDLRKGVPPPIAASLIADLTAEAARISQTVSSGLVPTTKDQVEALGNWRELVGDSVGILKDVGSLSSDLFRDYQPPSVAQLQRFAEHAQDTATAILQASRVYENDALENAKLFSEGVGATFETIGAGLQVFDRLRFSDLGVDPATLRAFTASSLAVLDSTQVLAERAGQIDPGALSSLSTATAAINAQAEALINLSAVPTGNLGGLAAGLGGGSSITFAPGSIVINGAAPGMDMAALANLVARQIQTQIGARR